MQSVAGLQWESLWVSSSTLYLPRNRKDIPYTNMHIYTIIQCIVPNPVRDLLSLTFRFVLAINVPLICWAIYLSLSILEILSTIAETLSSWLFETFSPILGMKACQTSSVQASAVLIVGADNTGEYCNHDRLRTYLPCKSFPQWIAIRCR